MYNTFNDIFNSDLNFIVDSKFLSNFETSDDYLKLKDRMEGYYQSLDQIDYQELALNNNAM